MGKSLRKASKGFKNRGRWDESFKDEQFQIPGKATKIRLYDEFDTVPHHWVEFHSKKKKGMAGFYALCINYDYENGEAADNGCPYCEAGLRVSNYTYGLMIHRKEQRQGNLQVRPIRLTPKCTSDILNLTEAAYPDEDYPKGWEDEDGEGPDATHPKYGFDITIKVGKKNNKTEYTVSYADGGKCPLTAEEKKAFADAAEQLPFSELALAGLETRKEILEKMKALGIGGGSDDEEESRGSRGGKRKKASADYNDYDEEEVPEDDEEGDDEDVVAAKPKSKKKKVAKKKRTAKKVTAIPDDDDEDDDDDDDRGLPWDEDDDDEDEGNERSYADDDEDDAPDDEDDDEDYEDDED